MQKKKLRMKYIVINVHMNVQEREQISTLAIEKLKAIEKSNREKKKQ